MIGNDIVDLQLARIESNWQRKGFLEKQFTCKEQEEILKSEDPFLKVWLFWSMKESAYKCYTQQHKKRFFAPQKFECKLTEENKGVVFFEENVFYTVSFFNDFYTHTIAEKNKKEISIVSQIVSPLTLEEDFKIKLAKESGVLFEEIEKRKSPIGVPSFYFRKKLLTRSCSISHHGNYGAFVFTLENEYKRRIV